ncbi:MAG TPA: trypsin-like peptidase domain-containing protein [Gemmatimonadaceae bacterium]|nr:trypsin-like peptidase domain-containing protein [Gemmatimonadaceae bacterium]
MTPRALAPVVLLLVIACEGASPAPSIAQAVRADPSPEAISAQRRTAITDAVAKVAPAVVTVQTEVVQRVAASPFDFFFGAPAGQQVTPGLGSGFIIREDGVIVTNAHVVNNAQKISVALKDGTTYPARLVGMDPFNDLAVLKIEQKKLPVAVLGTSRGLLIGEWAIAIGNPYGFVLGNTEPSVTAGVISATGRNLAAQSEGSGVYVDMIQTDASINPGNSGGPLVNALGQVIGVNSSIYSPSGGSVGLGFAIPIDRAMRVANDLLEHGKVRRPWIGVKVDVPQPGATREDLLSGATVRQVVPESPAATARIQAGDVLVRSRDRVLRNGYDWEAELLELRVGEEVPLVVRRGTREFQARVRIADYPEVNAPRVAVLKEIELVSLTPAIRAERGFRNARGALIVNVAARVSDDLGIQAGDLIVQINNAQVTDAQQAKQMLESLTGRGFIRMFLERGGRIVYTDFSIR